MAGWVAADHGPAAPAPGGLEEKVEIQCSVGEESCRLWIFSGADKWELAHLINLDLTCEV
jgi:hypothetical protein